MPNQPIVLSPHKILRSPAKEVSPGEIPSPAIQGLISDMRQTLAKAPDGIGLAAPQIGVGLQVFVISEEAAAIGTQRDVHTKRDVHTRMDANERARKREWKHFVFINPVLKKKSREKVEMAEGCLSLPGKFGVVPRPEKVSLTWLDERGKKHERGFARFFARVIQHEIDHLDGILISERAKKMFEIPKGETL